MILMGAGTNHWFHSDTIYRAFLALTTLTGCQGVNGGGWAHYVGQEKCRPVTGWAQLAFGLDWSRPPRQMIQTAYWYLHTDQFRYDHVRRRHAVGRRPATGQLAGKTTADVIAQSARMGWMPSYPTFDRNPLDPRRRGRRRPGRPVGEHVVDAAQVRRPAVRLRGPRRRRRTSRGCSPSGGPTCSARRPRATSTSSSTCSAPTARCAPPRRRRRPRPKDVVWRDEAPEGKLDLLLSLDFRMTSTTIFSDVVLPAATWYEKHDLNTTDMHPFIHSFNPAIAPPWQTRTDWDAFQTIARDVQRARREPPRRPHGTSWPCRCCTTPPTRWRTRTAWCADWKAGECEPVPGRARCRSWSWSSATTPRSPRRWRRSAR